jgi:ribosomal protein L11 methyltransferase
VDGDGYVEYAIYGAPGELPALPEGDAEVAGVTVRVSGKEVDADWAERWKRFHEPVLVGGRLFIRPPWTEPRPGTVDLVIDPGQAFGTGAHPTTRLCLELLLGLEPRGSLADLGCGSGVLAIAAAKLGFAPIVALDNESAALDATRANARANAVELERVEGLNLRERPPPAAGTVTANLTAPLLRRVAELIVERPSSLIVSGLLDREADEVATAFGPGLHEVRRLTDRGWSAMLLSG